MTLFAVFLVSGLLELWGLLMLWGFSRGPVNAMPLVTLVGCLLLLLIASPLALFLPRVSPVVAAIGAALVLTWPVAIARAEPVIQALPFAVLPITVMGFAAWQLWRTRQLPWLVTVSKPRLWIRVGLCCVPVALFVVLFNARLVLALLWAGPPK